MVEQHFAINASSAQINEIPQESEQRDQGVRYIDRKFGEKVGFA
jgi:hypothetical protein